jgi:hypothetical protein
MEVSKRKRISASALTGLTFLGLYAAGAALGFQIIREAPCGFLGFFMIGDLLPKSFPELSPFLWLAFPGLIFFALGASIGLIRQEAFVTGRKFLSVAILLTGLFLTLAGIAFLYFPVCD